MLIFFCKANKILAGHYSLYSYILLMCIKKNFFDTNIFSLEKNVLRRNKSVSQVPPFLEMHNSKIINWGANLQCLLLFIKRKHTKRPIKCEVVNGLLPRYNQIQNLCVIKKTINLYRFLTLFEHF